ncbi:DUF2062 domain-containing protein [Bacillus sp. Marseille-P3661]|uniref:DUF2062 domain-containing protein n=1 Tax=Bacillus sp. Marseille-P3661 TaxID=1936234 RepID=UPI000C817F47|nr:DUF2062 domain-containing protein [Bacillus sp. Marseille-P3661]
MKIKRRVKYYLFRLFRLKASPKEVSIGLALGFIPNWFPTFGIGPIMSIGIAKVFRGNLIAAVIGGIIGTPIWPILFYLNYRTGSLFFNKHSKVDEIEDVEYLDAVNDTVGSLQSGSFLFLSGAIINVFISSLVIYLLVYILFKKYRVTILRKLKY